ncbi:DsbA family protein [Paenibacillus sp. 481]|nr:DsbA family protein [Paenibacillus sp. 481]
MVLMLFPVILVVLIGALFFLNKESEQQEQTQAQQNAPAVNLDLTGQPTLGAADAKINIVEFGDYKCPACKSWDAEMYPKLKADFIDTGKAKFTFVNNPFLAPDSQTAAVVGEAVFKQNPEAFWKYHHELYNSQGNPGSEWATKEYLLDVAKRVAPELDLNAIGQAVDQKSMDSEITKDLGIVQQGGVKGTPSVIVNGKLYTGEYNNYNSLKAFIEAAE